MSTHFHLHASSGCSVNIYTTEVLPIAAPQGAAILVRSLPVETSQKTGLVTYLIDTFATHAGSVYVVTDIDAEHKMAALTVVFSRLSNF